MRVDTAAASINLLCGGEGFPLLLLHGYPQSHVCWHRIAGELARHFRVIAPDLRGYGDSEGPPPGPSGEGYTFGDMAADQLEVMTKLGHGKFFVAGHDRGGRVAHRLALDHPARALRVAMVDILPTFHLWNAPVREWVLRSWHWSFMAQPAGLAERMIESVPPAEFLPAIMSRPGADLSVFAPEAYAEYLRCFTPKTIRAACADYRACATIGFARDAADRARKVKIPTLVVWGSHSHTAAAKPDVLTIWKEYCRDVVGRPIEGGHFLPEQSPGPLLQALLDFFPGPRER
ncbi:MAG: alpha/beta hydrolase [Betaproteobacteria bacterium]|nr:alpha/beta hydrolase [Betaproteobacteria bacterium]MBK9605013.1 alpha/beta hydrolase [Betaproteobacteria bacterium]